MSFFVSVWDILITYREGLFNGVLVTLKLCIAVWAIGLTGGACLGAAAAHWKGGLAVCVQTIAFLLSSIPILVFLLWLHYPIEYALGIALDPFYATILTLGIVNLFSVAEVIRKALVDFPEHFRLAGYLSGMSHLDTLKKIELPLIVRQVLPSLLILQVTMLHATIFSSLISVNDIFKTAQSINSQVYKPIEVYTALGLFFLAISLPLTGLAAWSKGRFTRNYSEY